MTLIAELDRIEEMINRLSCSERLWLIERLVHQMIEELGADGVSQSLSAEDQDETVRQALARLASEESPAERGAKLLREARLNQDRIAAAWAAAIEEVGISDEPISAEELQKMFAECGIRPEDNEFSRGIIEMREE